MPIRTVSPNPSDYRKPQESARPPDLNPGRKPDAEPMHLTLPVPPSLNHLYATVRGRRVKSEAGRRYVEDVAAIAAQCETEPLKGNVAVRIAVYRPAKRGDLDNYSKALLDSLKGICWVDDKQIVSIEAERFEDKKNPRVEVTVSEKR